MPVTHIHAHFAHRTTTVTWWAAHILDLPFSFTGHAKDIYQTDQNPHGLLARKMRAAKFVVTCTDANRQHLEAIAPGRPVHVMYHGLNADFARLLADAPAVDRPDGLRIISVGRLVDKKGFDILVDADRAAGRTRRRRDGGDRRRVGRPRGRRSASRSPPPGSTVASSSSARSARPSCSPSTAARACSRWPAASPTTAIATASPTC